MSERNYDQSEGRLVLGDALFVRQRVKVPAASSGAVISEVFHFPDLEGIDPRRFQTSKSFVFPVPGSPDEFDMVVLVALAPEDYIEYLERKQAEARAAIFEAAGEED